MLVSALSSSFFAGIRDNPEIPPTLSSHAQVRLAGGIPFIPDDQLGDALADAGVTEAAASAIIKENTASRLDGLRSALSVLAIISLIALFFTRGVPRRQPRDDVPSGDGDEAAAMTG